MTSQITREQVAAKATIHGEAHAPTSVQRTFELPVGLYVLTVGAYLGFLAIMALGFGAPRLAIPMVIFTVSIVMGFGVPLMWVRMKPDNAARQLDWGRFAARGIQTFTGPIKAGEAAAQVLVLPVLILFWGIVVTSMAAFIGS